MPPRRRVQTHSQPSSSVETGLEESAQGQQSEVQELRAQMALMSEAVQRQEETIRRQDETLRRQEEASRRQEEAMSRMMLMLEQRVQPVVAPPESFPAPSSPAVAPPVVPAVQAAPIAPVAGRQPSGTAGQLTRAEQREVVDLLLRFRQFDPPRFSGQSSEPWEAESWITAMERHFESLFVEDRFQVLLATHFLERNADAWWRRVRPVGPPGTQLLTWAEFRSLLLGAFFPESVRQRLEEQLRNLRQGDRPVHEYIADFNQLLVVLA